MGTSSLVRRRAPTAVSALVLCISACSSQGGGAGGADTRSTRVTNPSALADTLSATCPTSGRRGSVLVARPDPTEEETGITFKLLGDGAGPGVVLCRDVLYADAAALLALIGEQATVDVAGGRALIDATSTDIPAYRHEGAVYVAVAPFARRRRALLVPSPAGHPMDVTIWPRETLGHMKASGNTSGAAYEAAVREGLVPE